MKPIKYIIFPILLVLISYSVHLFLKTESIYYLTKEDGFYEYGGAFMFLFAGAIFLIIYFRDKNENKNIFKKRNIFFLLLGILFIFGFCEEISWGQRIFGIETPSGIARFNTKNEINLHNMLFFARSNEKGLKTGLDVMSNMDRIFSIFWISYCCVLPFLYFSIKKIKLLVDKILLPVPSKYIGYAFLINYLISKLMISYVDTTLRSIIEIKEFNFALLFFIISLTFYKNRSEVNKIDQSKEEIEIASMVNIS